MTATSVLIILDAAFGTKLGAVAHSAPVWIVQSNENNPVVERLWQQAGLDITTFRPAGFLEIMPTVDEHHSAWRTIEVRGQEPTTEVLALLREYGDGSLERIQDGFIFSRHMTSPRSKDQA